MAQRTIFISYAHEDERWKKELLPQLGILEHRHPIDVWHDGEIGAGKDWSETIGTAIDQAAAAVLLISPHFLASEFIRDRELPLLHRAKKQRGLIVIPVIVEDCAWENLEWLAKVQARMAYDVPEDRRPTFWKEIVQQLGKDLADPPPPAPSVGKRTNIVLPKTKFVGRDRERRELAQILKPGKQRLVTLSGGPGVGKTRLARQVGHDLLDAFPGGCWFASLATAKNLSDIARAVAQAFDVPVASGQVSDQDAIVDLLEDRGPLLLILDNFEHLVGFAHASVGYWLNSLPDVTFFVTSRAVLHLDDDEHRYPLQVFEVPPEESLEPAELLRYDSVRLFVERAKRVYPAFELDAASAHAVVHICRTVDGIALAIELAAGRIATLEATDIAKLLDDRFALLVRAQPGGLERHATLYALIDWSFDLLSLPEQQAFLQLCVFRGGFTLEAAEQIVDLSAFPDAPPVVDVVDRLYHRSLIEQSEKGYGRRFDMLVSIDDFGTREWAKRATPEEQEALARRWADYYIPYVKKWNAKVHTKDGVKALDLLALETDNIFEIQDWFLAHGEPVVAAEAILAFDGTMDVRGPVHLRVPRISRSLNALGDEHTELRVSLMTSLSAAHWSLGEWNEATELADAAVKLSAGARSYASAAALRRQARIRIDRGYLHRALLSVSRAKEVYAHLEGPRGAALIDGDLAGVHDRLGNFARAIEAADAAIAVAREKGNDSQHAILLNRKGLALWHHGHPREALAAIEEAERINMTLGARTWIGGNRTNAGLVDVDLDELDRAMKRFDAAESILQELRTQAWVAVNLGGRGRAFMMRGGRAELDQALQLFMQAGEISRKVYYPENISFHAGDMGRCLLLLGRFTEARRAVREAIALERVIGASCDLRHFGNLATLARIARRLGHTEECAEAIVRARELLEAGLDVSSRDRVRRVREDVEAIERLVEETPPLSEVDRRVVALLTRHGQRAPNAQDLDEIARAVAQSFSGTSYEYPWNGLEDELQEQGAASFPLFGYGSLVNRESARKTCRAENFAPALAFGVVRQFDYDMPDALRERYYPTLHADDPDRAVLNVQVTGFLTDVANGVAFDVALDEIEVLRKREVGYDLKPIVIVDWDGDGAIVPRSAFVLTAPNRLWKGRPLTNASLNPYPPYLQRCAAGAESFSPSFLGFWRDTTFLAGGETLIA